mmetsp:Transcript_43201/g.85181  ORF Transcript_43201/g.85181 Transcript_43201/m.85181 type:complete len:114 (+) Transcript_43201:56-397(+)
MAVERSQRRFVQLNCNPFWLMRPAPGNQSKGHTQNGAERGEEKKPWSQKRKGKGYRSRHRWFTRKKGSALGRGGVGSVSLSASPLSVYACLYACEIALHDFLLIQIRIVPLKC